MQASKFKFVHGGAEIQLPTDLIVQNWLRSLDTLVPPRFQAIPLIGQPCYGGINAGLVRGMDDTPDYFLIIGHPNTHLEEVQWGSQGEDEPGARSEWDGLKNTRALVESTNSHPAAEQIFSLHEGGFSDWYLPARRELSIAYGNVPELFKDEWYLSSTQYSALNAYEQHFDTGSQGLNHKGARARAFAVRRAFINSVI